MKLDYLHRCHERVSREISRIVRGLVKGQQNAFGAARARTPPYRDTYASEKRADSRTFDAGCR